MAWDTRASESSVSVMAWPATVIGADLGFLKGGTNFGTFDFKNTSVEGVFIWLLFCSAGLGISLDLGCEMAVTSSDWSSSSAVTVVVILFGASFSSGTTSLFSGQIPVFRNDEIILLGVRAFGYALHTRSHMSYLVTCLPTFVRMKAWYSLLYAVMKGLNTSTSKGCRR